MLILKTQQSELEKKQPNKLQNMHTATAFITFVWTLNNTAFYS